MNKTKILKITALAVLFSLLLNGCSVHRHKFGEWNIASTYDCTEDEYRYRICSICGEVEYEYYRPASGHIFSSWYDDMRFEKRYAICEKCGAEIEDGIYEPPSNFSRFYIYGTPNASVIPVEFIYAGINNDLSGYAKVSFDANESNDYYKKSYDLEIYSDSNFTEALNADFGEGVSGFSVYTLKSEYADKSSVRNLCASELWRMVTESRDDLDENISQLMYLGADHGFPMLLYTNGNFKGIYNFCLPNDEKLFGLSENEGEALIYSYTNYGNLDFSYSASEDNTVGCTVIFPKSEQGKSSAENSFKNFMSFVNSCTDEELLEKLPDYLDINAAIDYLICVYLFGADNNSVNFCNWVTYDGNKWIPSMYNLTYTFGIDKSGSSVKCEDTISPYYSDGILHSGTDAVLWEKLCRNYEDRILERYWFIRENVLNSDTVSEVFQRYISMIPEETYEAELEEYPSKKDYSGVSETIGITSWFEEKSGILDSVFDRK